MTARAGYASRIIPRLPAEAQEHFLALVDRAAGDSGCWPFMGSRTKAGYGQFRVGAGVYGAHRIAYQESADRRVYCGAVVRHSCDNPPCCNPAHLSEGTASDNAVDRSVRGRHGCAKLTPEDVAGIRGRLALGDATCVIASQFGVSHTTIWGIRTGRVYRWVSDAEIA